MKLTIVPAFAALFAFFFVVLSLNVIRMRRKHKVGIGTGLNSSVERAMRVHANFAEYVPLSLLLILCLEINQSSPTLLVGLCVMLLFGRLVHAYGVSQQKEKFAFRVTGMMATFSVLILEAMANIGSIL